MQDPWTGSQRQTQRRAPRAKGRRRQRAATPTFSALQGAAISGIWDSKATATDSKTATSAASQPAPPPKTKDQPTTRGSTFNRRQGVKIRPSLTQSSDRAYRRPKTQPRHNQGAPESATISRALVQLGGPDRQAPPARDEPGSAMRRLLWSNRVCYGRVTYKMSRAKPCLRTGSGPRRFART